MPSDQMTLHEAMVEVLRHREGWMSRDALAAEIERRDLYRRRNGESAPSDQLRLRALKHPELFECADKACTRIRLVSATDRE